MININTGQGLTQTGFYTTNYDRLDGWQLQVGKKIILKNSKQQFCRFCNKGYPDTTFSQIAHAIPESIGNKSLTTDYECDECNKLFGTGIENDFGAWSKPSRTFGAVRGKNGVPTLKNFGEKESRIELKNDAGFVISLNKEDSAVVMDEENRTVTFKIKLDPFTPIAVYKAFVKMGVSVFPELEIQNFKTAIQWIMDSNHKNNPIPSHNIPIFHRSILGPSPYGENIVMATYRRKANISNVPYAFFIITYGNETFQVFMPSPEKDEIFYQNPFRLQHYSSQFDSIPTQYGLPKLKFIDLSDNELIKGGTQETIMRYQTMEKG